MALAMLGPLAMPGLGGGDTQLHMPSLGSVRSAAVSVVDFLTGQHAPAPSTPKQQSGTAAGHPSSVPAAVTRAVADAMGREPHPGRGQRPAYQPHGLSAHESTTGEAHGVFNPKTSTVVSSGSTAQSVLYKNADGSYTRHVYQAPVNYKTSSGTWAPIDESLVKGAGGRWQEKANSIGASFAANGSQPLGTMTADNGAQSVSFSLAGASGVTGVPSGSSVTYPAILPQTDVTETASSTGVSEALTLHSAQAGTSWVFPLTLTGLTPVLDGDEVDLKDSSGNVVWVIPPAVARSGPVNLAVPHSQASSVLAYQLVPYNGGTALEMTLDQSWLDAKGRVFPVVVDPSLTPRTSASTYAESLNGVAQTENNGSTTHLPAGTVSDNGTWKDVSYLSFPNIGSSLPNQHVTSASLSLFDIWAVQCTYTEEVYAYQVTSSWTANSNITWPGPSYSTKDAQWTGLASSAACANTSGLLGKGAWISLGVNSAGLSLLNDWTLNNGTHNYGFAIAPSLTDAQMWKQFDSAVDTSIASTAGGNCTGNCAPYLSLTYTTDTAPQVDHQYPPSNYNSATLTPELIASGHDPDSWPSALKYDFTVYNSAGTKVADSGEISATDWTVPSGDLTWGQTYYWTVQDYDGLDTSTSGTTNYFSTPVPQPLVTSGLSQNESGPGYDAGSGDYTTSSTDAQVPTVGPALEITRDYNSQDPRLTGAFGASWSSVLDMKVSPGQASAAGTTATQVVTYPDGEEVAFGVTSSGTYVAPPGRYATLASVSSGGFTLTDKNDTVYTFTQSLGSGAGYGITSITDALGHTETFGWTPSAPYEVTQVTSASGRTLALTWTTPSPPISPHVSQVTTQDVTPGTNTTALTWGYNYSGDQLSSVCPPADSTHCTVYTYTSGSDYPEAVLDSGPASYWRLDEGSGTKASSSVMLNEGTDNATYSGTTVGTDTGPLTGSSATAATFNGTSSSVSLPGNLVMQSTYVTVGLWFKTTSASTGTLFSTGHSQPGTSSPSGSAMPVLYVGSDGKLYGHFWNNTVPGMSSTAVVNDGKWHYVALTGAGNIQYLYLDGKQIGSLSGQLNNIDPDNMAGTGVYNNNGWPAAPSGNVWNYFTGDISDVAFWTRPLTANEVSTLYGAGTHQANLLTKVTRPSGNAYASVSYDALTARTTSVTDDNGGKWTLNPPTVGGSSQVYEAAVLGNEPQDYWRLGDSGTSDAVNEVNGGTATYNDVTQGVTGGQFADTTVDTLNGTDSYILMPQGEVSGTGNQSISLWFKTSTAGGVLWSSSADPVTSSTTAGNYNPSLYIGTDGKLRGEFWEGSAAAAMGSTAVVDDGKWHNVVIAASSNAQVLYLDGTQVATLSGTVAGGAAGGQLNDYVGAGFIGGGWPDESHSSSTSGTGYPEFFKGQIGDVAFYPSQLTAAQVSAEWTGAKSSTGSTPTEVSTVTDPGGHSLSWEYDLLNGGRVLQQTDARGQTTTYGYDVDGFQNEVVNPDGDYTQTGYDVRGNVVSTTTCQDQSAKTCSTSYDTYYPDDTSSAPAADPRNDMLLTSSDGRSASSTDTTYQTKYAYNSLGELTAETTPPVAGFSSGRTTSYLYTDGTSTNGGYQGAIPPKGLQYQVTTPGGAVTKALYYANGDVAETIDPNGQTTTYAYDGVGRKTSETVTSDSYPNGLTTSYGYDKNGQVVTEADPPVTNSVTGAIHTTQTTTVYDVDGNMTSQAVADTTGGDASRTVTSTYDAHDMHASETDADGHTTSYTYDAYGNKATVTDPDGNVTSYTYDGNGDLLTTSLQNYTGSPSGSQAAAPLAEESRSYDPAGRLAQVTDSMGRATNYAYTDNGLLASITQTSADGTQTFTQESDTYDAAGNLVKKVSNNGATTTNYTVDAASRVTQQVLDPSGLDRTTSISYTPDDQQASVTESGPSGATQATNYTYDPNGNETSQSVTQPGAGGPAAWYPLTQTSGTSVPDSAAGGQSATATGTTWTGSNGASFTGAAGQGITTSGPVLDTTGSFTVATWVNLAGDTTLNQTVLSQDAGTDSGFYLKYYPNSGKWQFVRPKTDTTNPVNETIESASPAATGTWTFLVGTYNASTETMTFYVNGSAQGTCGDPTPIASTGPLVIGRSKWDGSASDWFDGNVADVQAYPRALTAAQVSALYQLGQNGTVPAAGSPAGRWNLTQTSGTAVPDASGTGNQATATGVTWTGSAASFAGNSGQQIATSGPVIDTTSSFTVAAWAEVAGNTTINQTVVSQDAGTDAGFYLKYWPSIHGWEFARPYTDTTNPANANAAASTGATPGTWYFLTGTYNASTGAMTLYINGAAAGTATDSTPIASNGPLAIGRSKWNGSDTDWFDGSVADVQAYKTALTAAQVQALYQAGQDSGTAATGTQATTWALDQRGLPTSMTDPDGNVTNYSYDEAGQLAQTTQPPVTTETYGGTPVTARPESLTGYDTFGDTTENEDPNGNVTTYGYDANGQQVSETLPAYTPPGSSSPITATDVKAYDNVGQLSSETDALGNKTSYSYDQLGDLTSETDPDGGVTSYTYDSNGEQLSQTSPTGAQTQKTYDFLGRDATSTQLERYSGSGTASYTTSFGYGTGGWLATSQTPDAAVTSRLYDAAGELTSVTDPAGNATKYGYDDFGRQTGTVNPDGTSTTAAYDASGHVTSTSNLDSTGKTVSTTSSAYDSNGNELSSTDALGNATTFTYDPSGSVTQEVQPVSSSSGITVSFGYDAAGNQTRYTDGNGTRWYYTYNSWGLPESRIEPATSAYTSAADSTYTMSYDADGRAVSQTAPGGVTLTDSYNNSGELTGESGTGADAATATRTLGYDAAGRLTSAATSDTAPASGTSNATSESFTYNDRGQVLTAAGTAGSSAYGYNGDGLVTSVADAAGTTSYSYDSADRLHTLSEPASGTTATYSYNSDNMVNQISYGSDVRTLGYDSQHRLTSDTLKTSAGSTVASVGYGYDAAGHLTSLATAGLAGASSNAYTYDKAGRVTSWNNGTTTTSYGYDNNGNLTQNGSKTYTYDARDQLTSDGTSTYGYTARGTLASQSSSAGTVTSSFDAFGDQVTQGPETYVTDGLGRVTSATDSASGPAYNFSYDGSSGTIASDGANTYTWDPSGSSLVGVGTPGGSTTGALALTNTHGDVIGQFTASGTSVSGSTAYDPWGNVTATSGVAQGRLGFQSGWTDPATGKVAMGARWYDPSNGDFTSADTVQVSPVPDPAMADPFAYAGDDPLDGTDPSGHCGGWFSFACSVVSHVTHAVSHVVHAVAHAVTSAWYSTFSFGGSYFAAILAEERRFAAAAARAARSVVHHVYDAARWGVHAYHSVVHRVTYYAVRTYHTVTTYARHAYHRVVHAVRTVYHAARRLVHRARDAVVRAARTVVHHVAAAAKSVAHHVAAAGVYVGRHLKKAASVTARVVVKNAAAIGGAVTGIAVFAGCEAVTAGAGSLACAAASGAAANAVSYAISAAQKGSFSWSALGETTAEGAVEGLAGGALGEVASAAGGAVMSSLARDGADEATSIAGDAGEESLGASCGGKSFTAGTLVLLASGKAVPISSLKKGDKVMAVNTKTGKQEVKDVAAVLVHHDTDLYDLTVEAAGHAEVIHTTSSHLFWDPSLNKFLPASNIKAGEHLKTPDGRSAVVGGGSVPTVHDGWMWDLTVQDDHDFYVEPAVVLPPVRAGPSEVAVLVHNCTISARSVRFTQDSAGKSFKDGRSVMDLATGLSDGSVDPSSLPPIRIFNDEQGVLRSLDNRRLFAGQYADVELPYQWATPSEIARRSMTFVQNGDGITIRGIGWFNFLRGE